MTSPGDIIALWLRNQHDGPPYNDDADSLLRDLYAAGFAIGRRGPVEVQEPVADYKGSEFVDIGPECFANRKRTVVCWQGENYYRAPSGSRFRLARLLGVGR